MLQHPGPDRPSLAARWLQGLRSPSPEADPDFCNLLFHSGEAYSGTQPTKFIITRVGQHDLGLVVLQRLPITSHPLHVPFCLVFLCLDALCFCVLFYMCLSMPSGSKVRFPPSLFKICRGGFLPLLLTKKVRSFNLLLVRATNLLRQFISSSPLESPSSFYASPLWEVGLPY